MKLLISLPDKSIYKTTVTELLRQQIFELSLAKDYKRYLEIGCDHGYTMISISGAFEFALGIDIDPARIEKARCNAREYGANHLEFKHGTSEDLPVGHYDIVLIDAAHDYDNVVNDTRQVLDKNLAKTFDIVYHDYGLVNADVKRAVNELFDEVQITLIGQPSNWNPMGGPIDDFEAAIVSIAR